MTDSLVFFSDGSYLHGGAHDLVVQSEFGLRDDLTSTIFVEGKIKWDWDSSPAEDSERQDVDYILGVGYRF